MKLLVTITLVLTMFTAALAQTAATPGARLDRAQIERAQRALKDAGHDPGAIDGVMGAKTGGALKAYQKQQGLHPTGRLDETTLAKLGAAQPSASTSSTRSPSAKGEPGSTQTGGDQKPSPADPAQATKTGANAGEGASYSRSNEKK